MQPDAWDQAAIAGFSLLLGLLVAAAVIQAGLRWLERRARNRRTGLRSPYHDARSSIDQWRAGRGAR